MKHKLTKENIVEHLITYQLAMIDKTMEQAKEQGEWYSIWTMTQAQHEQYKGYALPLLQKIFKIGKSRTVKTFAWFDLNYGLRIKD